VAATADVHCSHEREREVRAALDGVAEAADLLLLAGDLTTLGEPDQAALLGEICAELGVPTFAVLGNHDWHAGRHEQVSAELVARGVQVLEGTHTCSTLAGQKVGIAGVKGFVGGFAGHSHLADFGEPALRELYLVAGEEARALDRGLREIALCPLRIAVLHYSPTADTLLGEPDGIWAFLGSDRLAAPIAEHEPDLVVHGHAHAGSFAGAIASVPVYNVSMAVLKQGYAVFELTVRERASAALH
jgi:Icc-related predicted phosphoesterase